MDQLAKDKAAKRADREAAGKFCRSAVENSDCTAAKARVGSDTKKIIDDTRAVRLAMIKAYQARPKGAGQPPSK